MTAIGEALHNARQQIAPVSDSAGLDAQLLLAEVLQVNRAYVLAHPEQALTADQSEQYAALVGRCAAGEPLPYLLGRKAFYDREFIVSPAVLIPRPETELLIEQALDYLNQHPKATVVDVGTGSGALAVTLAALCPQAQVYATDISPDALEIARQNAAKHNAHVTFFQGDLLTPLIEREIRADVIVSNPPYIVRDELAELAVSRYEPRLALDGGPDGLDVIRRLMQHVPDVSQPGTCLLFEIGADQGAAVLQVVRAVPGITTAEIIPDYAGLDRIMRATRV